MAPKTPRVTKIPQLIALLKLPEGVTIDEVVKALDWQAHTVRDTIAAALKKKLGLKGESEKVDAERVDACSESPPRHRA